jgi:hypothetical protein
MRWNIWDTLGLLWFLFLVGALMVVLFTALNNQHCTCGC